RQPFAAPGAVIARAGPWHFDDRMVCKLFADDPSAALRMDAGVGIVDVKQTLAAFIYGADRVKKFGKSGIGDGKPIDRKTRDRDLMCRTLSPRPALAAPPAR